MARRNTGFPDAVRQVIVARSAGCCEVCGSWTPNPQIHHRRPRGMGGSRRADTNTPANAIYCCAEDHALIEKRRKWAYRQGLLLRQVDNPAERPVVLRYGRVLLGDDGSIAPYEQAAS